MLWAALILDELPPHEPQRTEALEGLASWCLQFTPRVALLEASSVLPAVVMELEASVRLFGGTRLLVERIKTTCSELGVKQLSWAPHSLAALALARAEISNGFMEPIETLLDPLPIDSLSAVSAHRATLMRLGCQTLGQVRALPRGGMSRRFGADVLHALDQAYGLKPEVHSWVVLAETFQLKLELPARVEHAPALLFAARRLLLQLTGWLSARHCGVTAYVLKWRHDAMRARSVGDGGELLIRTAQPTRDIEHLTRLLTEHLAKVSLEAPVGELELCALDVQPLSLQNFSLLPASLDANEGLALALERIAARLGKNRVLRPVVKEDHRLEWMCAWQEAAASRPRKPNGCVAIPQPSFVMREPVRLAMREHRPLYQGALQLLMGPHRVESGWWDRVSTSTTASTLALTASHKDEPQPEEITRHVTRDYWVALSEHAGVLWIFQTRLATPTHSGNEAQAWYLHGSFA
jgi:protein ImuB